MPCTDAQKRAFKTYYENHKEIVKLRQRAYYIKNRETILKRQKEKTELLKKYQQEAEKFNTEANTDYDKSNISQPPVDKDVQEKPEIRNHPED